MNQAVSINWLYAGLGGIALFLMAFVVVRFRIKSLRRRGHWTKAVKQESAGPIALLFGGLAMAIAYTLLDIVARLAPVFWANWMQDTLGATIIAMIGFVAYMLSFQSLTTQSVQHQKTSHPKHRRLVA